MCRYICLARWRLDVGESEGHLEIHFQEYKRKLANTNYRLAKASLICMAQDHHADSENLKKKKYIFGVWSSCIVQILAKWPVGQSIVIGQSIVTGQLIVIE